MEDKVKPNHRMIVNILHTANHLDFKISKVLKQYGVTHVQFNIMRILKGAHPSPLLVGEVKARIVFSNSDITRLITRLQSKGIVKRTPSEKNKRQVEISISKLGLELSDKILIDLEETLENFYRKSVSEEEAKQVSTVLERLRE